MKTSQSLLVVRNLDWKVTSHYSGYTISMGKRHVTRLLQSREPEVIRQASSPSRLHCKGGKHSVRALNYARHSCIKKHVCHRQGRIVLRGSTSKSVCHAHSSGSYVRVGALHDARLYTRVSSTVMLCGLQWTRELETGLRGYFVSWAWSHRISHVHITYCTCPVERDKSTNSRIKRLAHGRFCECQVGVSNGSVDIRVALR